MSNSMSGATGFGSSSNKTGQKVGGRDIEKVQTYTPEQMQLFNRMLGNVGQDSYTSRLAQGDQSLFNDIEAPAYKQFNEAQGLNASRFSFGGGGKGAMSARNGSGFQNSTNQASQDFAGQLQAQRMGLQQNAIKDLHNMSQQLLGNQPYNYYEVEPKEKMSGWQRALGIGLPIAGGIAGGFFGGPMGAAAGASAGNQFASAVNGQQGGAIDYSGISKLPTKWGN